MQPLHLQTGMLHVASYPSSWFSLLKDEENELRSRRNGEAAVQVEWLSFSKFIISVIASGLWGHKYRAAWAARKGQKSLMWFMWKMAMDFFNFHFLISLWIHHHFANFKLPIGPGFVLFNLAMLIFKIIKQWRISNLSYGGCPVPLSPSSSFTFSFFVFQIQIFTHFSWYLQNGPNFLFSF